MMVILTGPISLLCFYLAFLCLRRNFRKHALILGGFAFFFLVLSVIILGAGYYTWQALDNGSVASLYFPFDTELLCS